MTELKDQENSELFDATEEPEETPVSESNTEKGEEIEKDGLDLEDKAKTSKAEENRQKQIQVYQTRIDNGEIALEDIPHKWIKDAIKPKSKVETEDLESIVDKKISEREAEREFTSLKNQLNSMKLTKTQKQSLEAEYQDLREVGASKAVALQKALRLAGVELPDDQAKRARREGMSLPKAGYYSEGKTNPSEDTNVMDLSPEERMKEFEKIRNPLATFYKPSNT